MMIKKSIDSFFVLCILLSLVIAINSLTVHLIPHTHDDVGWLKTVDEYFVGLNKSIQHAGVRYVIDSVLSALERNPERRFVYVEQAFFQRWWRQADEAKRERMRKAVASGQLEFINGGWSMHDEATPTFIDMIDSTSLGHMFILNEFGAEYLPTIGWQIDTFGHSSTQASLLSGVAGFDGIFFGRIDYQDHNLRMANQEMELVWRSSPSLGSAAQVFTHINVDGNYNPPNGLCFDYLCSPSPIKDDPSLEDYDLDTWVEKFVTAASQQANNTKGPLDTMNIMWNMGSDFQYENAEMYFINLDKLIKAVRKDGRVNATYSTPRQYLDAKNKEPIQWNVKTDDFFPYSTGGSAVWSGYYSSRPTLKRYVRVGSSFLQISRQIAIFAGAGGFSTERLAEAMGVCQHHDAVSGTEKQHVAYDYAKSLAIGIDAANVALQKNIATLVTSGKSGYVPQFSYCPLLNQTYCPPSQSTQPQILFLYNGLVTERIAPIRIPVSSMDAVIYDMNGNVVSSDILPSFETSSWNSSYAAPYVIHFMADLPALGYNTYFLTQNSSSSVPFMERSMDSDFTPFQESITLTNSVWSLSFDSNGLLSNATWLPTNQTYSLYQSYGFYYAEQNTSNTIDQAYVFHPASNDATMYSSAKIIYRYEGKTVAELRQQYSDWVYQTIRLHPDSPHIEFEWTVGPVDISDNIGKDVILRFNSSIQSKQTWYTDSNGREFQTRKFNYRPTWNLTVTAPVAGNYYPVTAVQYLNDTKSAVVINNDRSQGGASLSDGEFEFILHRRLLKGDGAVEALNETEGGLGPNGERLGRGLVVTGSHVVTLCDQSNATYFARRLQTYQYFPVHISLAPLTTSISEYVASHNGYTSFALASLPENLLLITLQPIDDQGTVLVRLAHMFGVGEHPTLSQPVTIDFSKVAPPFNSITELTLTGTQLAGSHKPMKWNTTSIDEDHIFERYSAHSSQQNNSTFTIYPMEVRTFALVFPQ